MHILHLRLVAAGHDSCLDALLAQAFDELAGSGDVVVRHLLFVGVEPLRDEWLFVGQVHRCHQGG